jgi:L-seryl-tRNA(Ser) seleniumtransferase
MLDCDEQTLAARAGRLADAIGPETEIVRSTAKVGGGALPLLELEGPAVALRGPGRPEAIMRALRDGDPPVIARIHDGQVLMDPRTLTDAQIEATAAAAREALNATR